MLDLRTLGVAIILADATLCAALAVFWRTQKTYAGFGHWVASQGLAFAGYLLLLLRGVLPPHLPMVAVSVLMVVGASLRSRAVLLFFDRPQSVIADVVASVLVLPTVAWFSWVVDAPAGRVLAAAACVAFVLGRAVVALAPAVRTHGAPAGATIGFLAAWPAALFLNVGIWIVSAPRGQAYVSARENRAFLLFLLAYDVAITILFLMLNTNRLRSELVATQGALERLAVTDALTGLPNRRKLEERLSNEWRRRRRTGSPLSLLVIDVDHFKAYNDGHGHLEGDSCLVRLAIAMHGVLREGVDLLVRLGGEEFVAMLPETGPDEAAAVAERVRAEVESLAVPHGTSETAAVVTVSVGWAAALAVGDEAGTGPLLARADAALYRAKQQGRNRVAGPEAPAVQ